MLLNHTESPMLRIDIVSASKKVSASGKFKTVKKAAAAHVSFCKRERERSPAGGEQFVNVKQAKHQTTYYEDEVEDAAMSSDE